MDVCQHFLSKASAGSLFGFNSHLHCGKRLHMTTAYIMPCMKSLSLLLLPKGCHVLPDHVTNKNNNMLCWRVPVCTGLASASGREGDKSYEPRPHFQEQRKDITSSVLTAVDSKAGGKDSKDSKAGGKDTHAGTQHSGSTDKCVAGAGRGRVLVCVAQASAVTLWAHMTCFQ
jgi:hypothetical protein